MARIQTALLSALPLILLASCARNISPEAENEVAGDANAAGSAVAADPGQAPAPAGNDAEAVRPPDAVSHPDGYLPIPVNSSEPAEPAAEDPPGGGSGPATEDEYLRNQQGR